MIQFNLLPDVKMQFVRAQRLKYLVTLGSIVASAAALVVLGFMLFTVKVVQSKSLNDLNKDIAASSQQLKDVEDLNKILTVQNQLNTITGLHDQKVVTTRLFPYINQLTPGQITINNYTVDFEAKTMSIVGEAPSLDIVNILADNLKYSTYKAGDTSKNAFSNVVLSAFSRDAKKASYTLTFGYDETIFNSNQNVTLNVPAGVTADPSSIFKPATEQENGNR